MATIRKRGHQYQVQIRRTGFSSISRSFYTLSDAKEWARLKEREADRLELGPSTKALATITLGELVERYKENVTPTKKSAKTEGIMLTAFLRTAICKKPLSQLTVSDFSEFRDERMKSVKPVSIRRQLMTIRAVLRVAAIEWDVPLRTNPLAELN